MDILEKNRILIDAIEVKIDQLNTIKNELVDEYNQEVIARQQAAAQQRAAQEAAKAAAAKPAEKPAKKEEAKK